MNVLAVVKAAGLLNKLIVQANRQAEAQGLPYIFVNAALNPVYRVTPAPRIALVIEGWRPKAKATVYFKHLASQVEVVVEV